MPSLDGWWILHPASTRDVLLALQRAGADMVELGALQRSTR